MVGCTETAHQWLLYDVHTHAVDLVRDVVPGEGFPAREKDISSVAEYSTHAGWENDDFSLTIDAGTRSSTADVRHLQMQELTTSCTSPAELPSTSLLEGASSTGNQSQERQQVPSTSPPTTSPLP
ncbi:MAG: hypothetical protein ACE3JU_11590 [Paenibacillus sp.]|uniref:hypothetical protein n=1 Tax=Paenibacillus sp. TaxID=58172 RepID=UPI003B82597D